MVVLTVGFFAAGGALGGRAGLALASAWVMALAAYCLVNFWHCREAHCVVTGPGWSVAGLLGFAAVLTPGAGLAWYRPEILSEMFLVVFGLGYALECTVRMRTGDRILR
jgi:hypothetical protein